MEQGSYGAFSSALRKHAAQNHIPLNGSIEITHRCSLDCEHCYNNLPMSDAAARGRELSKDELFRIIREIADAGGLYLLLTGGEILARKDFLEIYDFAKSLGFIITLFTNGTLITEKVADALAKNPPFTVEITLYGHTKETYERLTGVRGSFERARRGIRLLTERKVHVSLKTVGVTHTLAEMEEMRAFALAEVGAPLRFDSLINGRIDGKREAQSTRLPPERIVELDLRDPRRVEGWKNFAVQFGGPVNKPEARSDRYHCGGGITSYAIDPEGKLSICVLSKRDQYDLRQGTFEDGWNHFLKGTRAQQTTRVTKCTTCSIKAMCGMCPAMGELETGDPDEPVPFLCEVAHLRAKVLEIDVPAHGDCEFCASGAKGPHIERSAETVRRRAAERESRRSLPLLDTKPANAACSSEGGGCGSHALSQTG